MLSCAEPVADFGQDVEFQGHAGGRLSPSDSHLSCEPDFSSFHSLQWRITEWAKDVRRAERRAFLGKPPAEGLPGQFSTLTLFGDITASWRGLRFQLQGSKVAPARWARGDGTRPARAGLLGFWKLGRPSQEATTTAMETFEMPPTANLTRASRRSHHVAASRNKITKSGSATVFPAGTVLSSHLHSRLPAMSTLSSAIPTRIADERWRNDHDTVLRNR